jgi:hypothetical protein
MPRRTVPLAVKAATLFALCTGLPLSIAAGADPGGHQAAPTSAPSGAEAHRRADSAGGSTSVQVRVLPATSTPTPTPTPTSTTGPTGPANDGDSAIAGSDSGNDIDADVNSGGWSGSTGHNGTSSHLGRHGTGPYEQRHHGSHAGRVGHGSRKHGAHHASRRGLPLHGLLPFTGRGMTAALLTGTATVLTGTILVWLASLRRRRPTPRA